MEKFEIFFVNLDVCLSFSNVTLSISSKTFFKNITSVYFSDQYNLEVNPIKQQDDKLDFSV